MPHPSEALLLAFADDELGPAEAAQVSAHVQGCGVCRHALRDVRDAMAAVRVETAILDAAEPASWRDVARPPVRPARPSPPRQHAAAPEPSSAVALGAAADGRPVRETGRLGRAVGGGAGIADARGASHRGEWGARRPFGHVALRWAAILLVFVAGGATAMLAPRWRALVGGSADGEPRATSVAPAPAAAPSEALRTAAAVSVLPRDGRATVVLQPGRSGRDVPASPAVLVVTISDRADVQVTVASPLASAGAPRFRTADGRLDVALAGDESRVEVEVPAALAEGHIVHGTRTVVTVRGGLVVPRQASTTGVPLGAER